MLFLSIASFQPLLAQSPDPIAITPDPSFHESITRSVEIAIDPSLEWTAPDIVNGEGDFVSFTEPYLDAGLTDARVWLRFELRNTSQRSGPWRVDIQRQYTKEIRLFMVQDGVIEELLSSSDDLPFDARKFPNRFLQAEFDLAPGETAQFLIGYRSSSTTFLPVFIGAPDAARYDHAVEERIDWLINGALFAMVVLSLLLTPLIGWRLSLSFSAYICAGLLYVGNADAYTFEFLWPQTPWLNDPMNLVTILLMAAGAMNFGRQLFVFRKVAPRFDKLLLGFTLLALTTSLLVLPFYEIRPFMIVAYCIVPVGASLQFVCGIVAIRLGRVGAWPFTFGALLVFSSFVYATIAHLLPGQFDLDNTLDYGHMVLLADSMAFAVAIMLRIVALRQERDDALEDSLAAAEEEARLNKALLQSQTDYWETRKLADARLSRLADVSHDIRQPLYSLRKSLGAMRGQDETVTEQMQAAFDYLESIAIAQPEGTQVEATAEGGRDTEAFPINAVLDNVHAIFVSQAEQAGKTLGYKPSSHQIETNPIVLMRIIRISSPPCLIALETRLLTMRIRTIGLVSIWCELGL
ncbi:MAG: 7TM-DISM domain-containing protein [Pseudomonadota bacterium]